MNLTDIPFSLLVSLFGSYLPALNKMRKKYLRNEVSLFGSYLIRILRKINSVEWNVSEGNCLFRIWFIFPGLKYFALNKFSVMEWQ
jgi:hypothetical protein